MVLPGTAKTMDQFGFDDHECRQYASTHVGGGSAAESSYTLQQRYDIGYQQCMYSKGHQIPMGGRYAPSRPPSPKTVPPPPPAGKPPPPPPVEAPPPAPPVDTAPPPAKPE
jgi:hypothetical protein